MQHDVNALLLDILHAAESIQMFTTGLRFETYCDLPEKRWAVERGFEIIGEAVSKALKVDATVSALVPEAPQMIAFRNVLIHDYAVIRDEQVWDTINNKLPELIHRLRQYLAKEEL